MCHVTSMLSIVPFMILEEKSLTTLEKQLLNSWSFRSYNHKHVMIRPEEPGLRWVTPAPFVSSGNVLLHTSPAGVVNAACAV